MTLPDLSIKRPIFISCLFLVVIVLGIMSYRKLGVDMYPNVTFPIIMVTTPYPGAGPNEVETLISEPMEDAFSTVSGVKELRSINKDSVSVTIVQFTLDTDIKYAEQQVRDKLSTVKSKFPTDAKEPVIQIMDVSDQPVLVLTLAAELPPAKLFDLADRQIRPLIEEVGDVGLVEVVGGRKREIQVLLDRDKLKQKELSATAIATKIGAAGKNVRPVRLSLRDARLMSEPWESLKISKTSARHWSIFTATKTP